MECLGGLTKVEQQRVGGDPAWQRHFLVVVTLGLALLTVGCSSNATDGSRFIDATTDVLPDRGTVVFTDDFHDPGSGWTKETLPSGTHFTYGKREYIAVATGDLHHYAYSPFQWPEQQLGTRVTATVSSGGAQLSGFGIGCYRGSGAAQVRYELLVTAAGLWFVERGSGGPSDNGPQSILKQGTSTVIPGTVPLTVEGICATLQGGQKTRLMLFLEGQQVADIIDTAATLPDRGWAAELIVLSSASAQSRVVFSNFTERDEAH
jgi:hypothetical protein